MLHSIARLILIGSLTVVTILLLRTQHDGLLRHGLPCGVLGIWSSGLFLLWRKRSIRWGMLLLPLLILAVVALPTHPLDPVELKRGYVAALARMEGSPYVWGGESRRGIDCSGLPRRALRDALWDQGMATGNGTAFREWGRQWWFDTSAKAMGENHRGFTRPIGVAGKLRDLDPSTVEAGDLAVTGDGRHVMVCLGHGEWIQADPGPSEVVVQKPAENANPWFDAFVTLHRWTLLD